MWPSSEPKTAVGGEGCVAHQGAETQQEGKNFGEKRGGTTRRIQSLVPTSSFRQRAFSRDFDHLIPQTPAVRPRVRLRRTLCIATAAALTVALAPTMGSAVLEDVLEGQGGNGDNADTVLDNETIVQGGRHRQGSHSRRRRKRRSGGRGGGNRRSRHERSRAEQRRLRAERARAKKEMARIKQAAMAEVAKAEQAKAKAEQAQAEQAKADAAAKAKEEAEKAQAAQTKAQNEAAAAAALSGLAGLNGAGGTAGFGGVAGLAGYGGGTSLTRLGGAGGGLGALGALAQAGSSVQLVHASIMPLLPPALAAQLKISTAPQQIQLLMDNFGVLPPDLQRDVLLYKQSDQDFGGVGIGYGYQQFGTMPGFDSIYGNYGGIGGNGFMNGVIGNEKSDDKLETECKRYAQDLRNCAIQAKNKNRMQAQRLERHLHHWQQVFAKMLIMPWEWQKLSMPKDSSNLVGLSEEAGKNIKMLDLFDMKSKTFLNFIYPLGLYDADAAFKSELQKLYDEARHKAAAKNYDAAWGMLGLSYEDMESIGLQKETLAERIIIFKNPIVAGNKYLETFASRIAKAWNMDSKAAVFKSNEAIWTEACMRLYSYLTDSDMKNKPPPWKVPDDKLDLAAKLVKKGVEVVEEDGQKVVIVRKDNILTCYDQGILTKDQVEEMLELFKTYQEGDPLPKIKLGSSTSSRSRSSG